MGPAFSSHCVSFPLFCGHMDNNYRGHNYGWNIFYATVILKIVLANDKAHLSIIL